MEGIRGPLVWPNSGSKVNIMKGKIRFVGYHNLGGTHWIPQFETMDSDIFPDNSIIGPDVARAYGIYLPEFPDYFKWQQSQFKNRLKEVKEKRLY